MKIKPKLKKSIFLITTASFLTPIIVACSAQPTPSASEQVNDLKNKIEDLSPVDNPLVTTLEDKTQKPNSNSLTSLSELDKLVNGTSFSALGNLPDGVTFSSVVSDISTAGNVTITLTFKVPNADDISATITLSGFLNPLQTTLNQLAKDFESVSSSAAPLSVLDAINRVIPSASSLNSIEGFDLLVEGNPFKNKVSSLPSGVTLRSKVGEVSQTGELAITVTFMQDNLQKAEAKLVFKNFQVVANNELETLRGSLESLSPLRINQNNNQVKPDLSSVLTLNDLNNFFEGNPFSAITMPQGVSIRATVGEIQNEQAEMRITLVKAPLANVEASIIIQGFQNVNLTQLNKIAEDIAKVAPQTSPLAILTSLNTQLPNASTLTSLQALDNLVEAQPFSDAISALPSEISITATVGPLMFVNKVGTTKIDLIFKNISQNLQAEASIHITGFIDITAAQEQLNNFVRGLNNVTINEPLLTTKADRSVAPLASSITKVSDLDTLVANTPFADALSGLSLPSETKMEVSVSEIPFSRVVTITLKFSHSDLTTRSAKILLSGFTLPQSVMQVEVQRILNNVFEKTSSESNPVITNLANKNVTPLSTDTKVRTITELDNLLIGTPFQDAIDREFPEDKKLPSWITISFSGFSALKNNGIGTFIVSLFDAIGTTNNSSYVLPIGGFNPPQQIVNNFASDLAKVSPSDNPLQLRNPMRLPTADNLTSLKNIDNLVGGHRFQNALKSYLLGINSNPSGAKLSGTVSQPDAQGNITLNINYQQTYSELSNQNKQTFSANAQIILSTSQLSPQDLLDKFARDFESVSPSSNPLKVRAVTAAQIPPNDSLQLLSAFDRFGFRDGVFTNALDHFNQLPQGRFISSRVGTLKANGDLDIRVTIGANGLTSRAINLVFSGFKTQAQKELELIAKNIGNISTEVNPLSFRANKSFSRPNANLLTSLASLDDLVEGTPFSDAISNITFLEGITINANVFEDRNKNLIEISLTFSNSSLNLNASAIIFIAGLAQ